MSSNLFILFYILVTTQFSQNLPYMFCKQWVIRFKAWKIRFNEYSSNNELPKKFNQEQLAMESMEQLIHDFRPLKI